MVRNKLISKPRDLLYLGGQGGHGGPGGIGGSGGFGEGPRMAINNINNAIFHMPEGGEIMFRQQDAILDWLSPINFFQRQADISQLREKGTGEWLLADPVFKEWESSSGGTLWCHGIRVCLSPSYATCINHEIQQVPGKQSLCKLILSIK